MRRHTVFCIKFQQKVANTRQLRVPAAKEIEDTLQTQPQICTRVTTVVDTTFMEKRRPRNGAEALGCAAHHAQHSGAFAGPISMKNASDRTLSAAAPRCGIESLQQSWLPWDGAEALGCSPRARLPTPSTSAPPHGSIYSIRGFAASPVFSIAGSGLSTN